jgi:hypothetical protein
MANAEHVDDMVPIRARGFIRSEPPAVVQVLGDAEMREEPRFLKDITEMAFVRRQKQSFLAVAQHFAIK